MPAELIDNHGVVRDLHTVALVAMNGTIDFMWSFAVPGPLARQREPVGAGVEIADLERARTSPPSQRSNAVSLVAPRMDDVNVGAPSDPWVPVLERYIAYCSARNNAAANGNYSQRGNMISANWSFSPAAKKTGPLRHSRRSLWPYRTARGNLIGGRERSELGA